jgi:hypothetical protein
MGRVYNNKQHHSPHKVPPPSRAQTTPIRLFSDPAWQQLTADIINDVKLVITGVILSEFNKVWPRSFKLRYHLIQLLQDANLRRGDRTVVPYDIVPFADGTVPIGPPVRIPPILIGCQQANS